MSRARRAVAVLGAFAVAAAMLVPSAAEATTVSGLTVTGRARYVAADASTQPVRGAKVQVCDDDRILGVGNDCELMAEGVTGSDGSFSLTASGGDLFDDLPDIYVRVFAEHSGGQVQLDTGLGLFTYCMATPKHENYDPIDEGFTFDVGSFSPANTVACSGFGPFANVAQEHVAWEQLEMLRLVYDFTVDEIGPTPKVSVLWPHTLNGVPFYTPIVNQIRMVPGFQDDHWTFFHEYGHHVLYSHAESPTPDYNNETCDETNPLRFLPLFGGHCFWSEEKGSIHWTEGFPNFFAAVVFDHVFPGQGPLAVNYDLDGDTVADGQVTIEDPYLPDGSHLTPAGQRREFVEAWTHIILHDLWDDSVDNHDAADDPNDSADRVQLDFGEIWDIVQMDPDPDDIFHNHPTTIREFRDLLVQRYPNLENRVNALYAENGVFMWGADLAVASVGLTGTASVLRGGSITVTDDTYNTDDARVGTGEPSRTAYRIGHDRTCCPDSITVVAELGTRTVAALDPGEHDTGSRLATIPLDVPPGEYRLQACADAPEEIYETQPSATGSMVHNCKIGPMITVENRVPVADAGGPYTFDEGAGGTLDGSGSFDGDGDPLTYHWSSTAGNIFAGSITDVQVALRTTLDDGEYPVRLEVRDPFGGRATHDVTVTVTNVAPVVDAGADSDIDEGTTFTRTVTVDDPGPDSFTATVDWGDGTTEDLGTVEASFDISRAFPDDAAVTVEVCVDDGDDTGCDQFSLGVDNVAPAIVDDPVLVGGDEGSALAAAAAFTDPGADTWSTALTWGDGNTLLAALVERSVPITHTYLQDGVYSGEVCVTDDDGGSDCAVLTATIANVAPAVAAPVVDSPVMALVETSVATTFTDPGVLDLHAASVDWGDGTTEALALTEPTATEPGAVAGSHTYGAEGSYTVRVCVTDDDDETCVDAQVDVVSPAEAAAITIDALRARGSSDPAVLAAIDLLDGSSAFANDGALDKLVDEDWVAALTMLGDAITALDGASTDETAVQRVLAAIAEAVARQRLADVEALGLTSKGALKQIAAIVDAIAAGRDDFDAGAYRAAVDDYLVATRKAVDLLSKHR
jgi:hypothetical protein